MTDDLKQLLAEITPGPWMPHMCDIEGGESNYDTVLADAGLHGVAGLAYTSHFFTAHEANARLIAMAPDLAQMVIDLRAEHDRLTSERGYIVGWNHGFDEAQYQVEHGRPSDGDIAPKWQFTETEMKAVEAERDRLREALTWAVQKYDESQFMRSADFHSADCGCLRCAMDNARAALGEKNDE